MKKYIVLIPFLLFIVSVAFAQKNVLVEIGDRKITADQFERIYQKNNTQLSDQSEVKTPAEYLEMFIDFKLKVIEAENIGLDTVTSFVEELKGYREELARPYLTDVSFTDSMVKAAYFRTVNEVNASHILLMANEEMAPADTLTVYNKAIEIREKFISGEATFEDLAKQYSEDPSAQFNGGNLGYFRAFQMVTPFENAAFETKPGQLSMPIRTRFGYHIIYVNDIRQVKPDIKVAHIMKMFSNPQSISNEERDNLKTKIDSIYQLVVDGEDFGELAKKYSDDTRSAIQGGEMNWIGSSFGVKQFIDAAYKLEMDGDISQVVLSDYGYHIIKRLNMRDVQSFEELKDQLTTQVKNDPNRSKYSHDAFVSKLKNEYQFARNDKDIKQLELLAQQHGVEQVSLPLPEQVSGLKLFSFAGKTFSAADYISYQFEKNNNPENLPVQMLLSELPEYEAEMITRHEDSLLENKHPDFAAIMQEYHDGILLFTIMEERVWNKAMTDTLGLEVFYQKNLNRFELGEHFDGLLVECANTQVREKVEEIIASGEKDPETIMNLVNTEDEKLVTISKGRWEKGDNRIVNYFQWGTAKPADFDESLVFIEGEMNNSGFKTLSEARGLYVSEYQDFLEKEWLKELRAKNAVKVNKKMLRKIKAVK